MIKFVVTFCQKKGKKNQPLNSASLYIISLVDTVNWCKRKLSILWLYHWFDSDFLKWSSLLLYPDFFSRKSGEFISFEFLLCFRRKWKTDKVLKFFLSKLTGAHYHKCYRLFFDLPSGVGAWPENKCKKNKKKTNDSLRFLFQIRFTKTVTLR